MYVTSPNSLLVIVEIRQLSIVFLRCTISGTVLGVSKVFEIFRGVILQGGFVSALAVGALLSAADGHEESSFLIKGYSSTSSS